MSGTQQTIDPDITIIIAEDDDVDAMAIERSLRADEMQNPIERVHDGVEALELLQKMESDPTKPYILLLDINMPRLSGLDLLRKIKDNADFAKNPVFVLTGSKSDSQKVEAYDLNVTGFINKDRAGKRFQRLANFIIQHWNIKLADAELRVK